MPRHWKGLHADIFMDYLYYYFKAEVFAYGKGNIYSIYKASHNPCPICKFELSQRIRQELAEPLLYQEATNMYVRKSTQFWSVSKIYILKLSIPHTLSRSIHSSSKGSQRNQYRVRGDKFCVWRNSIQFIIYTSIPTANINNTEREVKKKIRRRRWKCFDFLPFHPCRHPAASYTDKV